MEFIRTIQCLRLNRLCSIFTLSFVALALAAAPVNFPDAITQSRAIILKDIAPKVPGLSITVSVDGSIVWSEGFGYSDLAAKTPVTHSTKFRIGSVSKSLTSAGLGLLVEKGQLDLDAPIGKYIPDFPLSGALITTRLLAGHLGGIRNYERMEVLSNQPYPNLRAGLKIFENDALVATPGQTFSYSSYGWNIIGVIMEKVAKQDFLSYMQKNVLDPLNLTNTVPDRANVSDPQRSQFYETDSTGKFIIAPPVDSSYKWPSGGYLSTTEDLVRFGNAMLQPGFLKNDTRRLLFTSQTNAAGRKTLFGIGWQVGRTTVYHNGDSIGGTSVLLMQPSTHVVVALAANRGHAALSQTNGHWSVTNLISSLQFDRNAAALHIAKAFAPPEPQPIPPK